MSQWTKYHNERHTDYSGLQRTTTDPADIIIIIIIINCEFSCRCSAARSVRCSALRWLFTSYLDRWWQLAVWSCRRCRTEARSQAAGHADRADHAFCCPDRPTTDRYPTLPALSIHSRPGPSFQVSVRFTTRMKTFNNKCIGDDTKAATRQSLNCIKNKKKYGEKRFSIWQLEFLHLAMWHDHDIDFARWLYPAMRHVVLESWQWIHQVAVPCNVIRGSGMTCHWIRPNVRHMGILHLVSISTTSPQSSCHSAPVSEILSNSYHRRQKTMTSCRFSRWRISAILDFRDPIMGLWKANVRLPIGRQ